MRTSQNAHPYTTEIYFNRTSRSINSLIHRTSRLCNYLPTEVFPPLYDIKKMLNSIHFYLRNISLIILITILFHLRFYMHYHVASV